MTLELWKNLRSRRLSAEALLREMGESEPRIDVEKIAEGMGVRVRRTTEPANWSGALDARTDYPVIWVRSTDSIKRQRFTIAHEIAHLMLHPLGLVHRDVTFAGNPREAAANGYAARLLMPASLLEPLARDGRFTKDELADLFEVSPMAMEYRLDSLGYR